MIRRMLDELQRPDDQTVAFTPYGLGVTRVLTPEAALEYQQDVTAQDEVRGVGVTEQLEGGAVPILDRSTGRAEEICVRRRRPPSLAELAFLSAVGLVRRAQVARGIENCGARWSRACEWRRIQGRCYRRRGADCSLACSARRSHPSPAVA